MPIGTKHALGVADICSLDSQQRRTMGGMIEHGGVVDGKEMADKSFGLIFNIGAPWFDIVVQSHSMPLRNCACRNPSLYRMPNPIGLALERKPLGEIFRKSATLRLDQLWMTAPLSWIFQAWDMRHRLTIDDWKSFSTVNRQS